MKKANTDSDSKNQLNITKNQRFKDLSRISSNYTKSEVGGTENGNISKSNYKKSEKDELSKTFS